MWLVPTAVVWVVLCWIFNRERLPIIQTDDQRAILINGATFLGGYALFAWLVERFRIPWADRIFRLFYAWLMLAFVVGLALPLSLVLDDGIQSLVAMRETLTGGRVNEGVEPFADFSLHSFLDYPLSAAGVIIALGLAAGVLGIARRRYWPPILGLAHDESAQWERESETNTAAQRLADDLLRPGEVILAPSYYFPVEDVRFGSLVDGFADHVPEYPYRFLSAPRVAAERGLTPAYYVAADSDLPAEGVAKVDIGGYGPFVVERLPIRWGREREYGVARILEAPALE